MIELLVGVEGHLKLPQVKCRKQHKHYVSKGTFGDLILADDPLEVLRKLQCFVKVKCHLRSQEVNLFKYCHQIVSCAVHSKC